MRIDFDSAIEIPTVEGVRLRRCDHEAIWVCPHPHCLMIHCFVVAPLTCGCQS
jgi:hypothetical protein